MVRVCCRQLQARLRNSLSGTAQTSLPVLKGPSNRNFFWQLPRAQRQDVDIATRYDNSSCHDRAQVYRSVNDKTGGRITQESY